MTELDTDRPGSSDSDLIVADVPMPKERPRSRIIESEMRALESARKAEEAMSESIRLQLVAHVPAAIESLAALSRGETVGVVKEVSASTVRSASRDILEMAGGRPETRDPRVSDPSTQVHIYVQKHGPGGGYQRIADVSGPVDAMAELAHGLVGGPPLRKPESVVHEYEIPEDPVVEVEECLETTAADALDGE